MKKLLLIFSLILVFQFSCQKQALNTSVQDELGQLSFKMSMANAPENVVDVKGYLSSTSHDTIFFAFVIHNDSASVNIENILPGQWKLTVNAYDINNIIIYSGFTNVYVSPGTTTPVYLQLNPVTGSLEIIVTWGSGNQNDSTLIAYFPFNGNANDESGNGNNGNVIGAILTNDRYEIPNSAYSFDGIDDYIDVGNSSILKPQLPVTISLWIKPSIQGRNHILTTNYHYMRYFGIFMLVYNDGRIRSGFGDGGGISTYSNRCKYSTNIINANSWYHIVGVYRGAEDIDIYINGINDGGTYAGIGSGINYDNGNVNLGRLDTAQQLPPQYFNGVLDDIRFYNYELNQSEILALFNE